MRRWRENELKHRRMRKETMRVILDRTNLTRCNSCKAEFTIDLVPHYCPRCGRRFTKTMDVSL